MPTIPTKCALQSATIIAPVIGSVSTGVEVLVKHEYSPRTIGHSVSLSVAANMAGHFIKCVAVESIKSSYEITNADREDLIVDTIGGASKYSTVDYLNPAAKITTARVVAGAWNGYGYNAGHHPMLIEAIDSATNALLSGNDPVQSACIGATAGVAVILSKDYLYLPSLEYVDKIGVQANETIHGEL